MRALSRLCVAFLFALCAIAAWCSGQVAAPASEGETAVQLPEGVAATVNGEPISEQEWIETLKRVAGRSVMEFIIRHKVVHQAAKKQGIELTEAELQEIFDRKIVEAGGVAQLQGYLSRIGESLTDFKGRLHTETLLRRMAAEGVSVSDEELGKYYLEQYGRSADVQAIVTDSAEKAAAALAQVKSGADFGQVAESVSIDPATAENHGYIPVPITEGVFPKPLGGIMMTQALAEELFALEPGEMTGVIAGAGDSFYLFKMGQMRPARDVKFEDVKDDVRKAAMEYKIQPRAAQILQQLLNSADIRVGI